MSTEGGSKFENFVKNIGTAIGNLTTLEIKTVIGEYNIDAEDNITPDQSADFNLLFSKIDLIGGDITTHMSSQLVQDDFTWIREFHAHKEERGHEIIAGNIEAIKSLIELYQKTKKVNVD